MPPAPDAPALILPRPAFLDRPGLRAVLAALPEARVVGGAVRDALAGRAVADIDLASPLAPEAATARLNAAGLRALPTGIDHGTITAMTDEGGYEITTLRRDTATDGRHATVEYTEDWLADAARRDFTINALSMTADGAVFDWFGGIADLRARRVRFVGDARARVAEDYLRILRFFRFWARYGAEPEDAEAAAAIRAGLDGLAVLSPERVWSELRRILAVDDPVPAARLMAQLGVLAAVLPVAADALGLARWPMPADPLLRLAALCDEDSEALAARLRLSGAEHDRLAALRAGEVPAPGDTDDALRRLLADVPADVAVDRTFLRGGAGADWDGLRARLAAMPRPVFPLAGRDALALGAAPGPGVGAALRAVRDWWRAGGCVADAQACRAELARRLSAC